MSAVRTSPDITMALTVDGIRAAIQPALERLSATARFREDTRDYAYDDVYELAAHGVGLTGIARTEGGAGGTVRDVADLTITIARADSNVAQALRPTFLVAHQIAARHDVPLRAVNLERLRNRALFAGTGNERNGGASGSVSTTARRVEGGYVINGRKYYSTGGLYASYFSAQALTEDGTVVHFTVPVDRPGVDRLDDFDAIGQRLTQSGSTQLTEVRVDDDETVVMADSIPDNPWRGSFAQLYLAAVQAGIAARALDDAVQYVREKGRPIKHSSATRSVDDPYIRQTVGEIAARAQGARAAVLLAAEALQNQRGLRREQARHAGAEAAVTVAQAGVVAVESALRAAELLFDVGGGSITDRSLGFDRHWRNARTAANHNPRQWKLAVAGAYHLVGEEPPTTGLF
ncbi:acyl-CoA dehydrogenase family protein [Mycolicibacterium smegmatis]|uniref:Acyl-CoA dehydrogenase n=2 Tax=Mycolicibacterium smegmatis (strain ATCC 700084 / mc(2)155) TaxID=246196 RepID=I7FP27_MYCS2|nr:acyl-CoA dehydrogenase family protein [Mycolicibacterium smegmatis]ABK74629.1 acyl-CoA dehydrogenase [Mycolicibacterium smegmatis MC2 155]AFP40453.1 Putative Acyl-CoA dehydrogenase [Mycolicibacterium smegmatis MC2 155]AIU09195.1 acyl-CoA dehydrogenase [Mycolicibacterium smegmatis MC2 155]AIU15820.1 acyl-CoA dehydrogenase [Mycolicibacterium smegmatis]AIU22443.1 acyl-CoA dehydrogenase [Mycolicibacterium smegmatis]